MNRTLRSSLRCWRGISDDFHHGLLRLPDLHAPDHAILDDVDVLDDLIGDDRPAAVAHDLMDVDDDASRLGGAEAPRLDVGVDHAPLAGPASARGGARPGGARPPPRLPPPP